jgi:oligoendopeptidase F
MPNAEKQNFNAEKYRWDLSAIYSGIDDPQIETDLAAYRAAAEKFKRDFYGKLKSTIGAALASYAEIMTLADRLTAFFYLTTTVDLGNEAAKSKMNAAERRLADANGEYLQFFELEICALAEDDLAAQISSNAECAKHAPLLHQIRRFKPHLLSEAVEAALVKRAPFSAGSWGEFHDEVEADLRVDFEKETKTLTEMLTIMSSDHDASRREAALSAIDAALAGPFSKYAARAFSVLSGLKAVEDKERNYPSPRAMRDLENQIPTTVSDALHRTVTSYGPELVKRYYRLKARLLGLPILRWSDRNAPLPFTDDQTINFDQAVKIVISAYRSFSPTMAALAEKVINDKHLDAPAVPGKRSGAFNYTFATAKNKFATYVMLNYLGKNRDVVTLAHELGHAVHGLLSAENQGALMFRAPMAYAETASVFGEEITFRSLLETCVNPHVRLALICARIDESMNTVIRQIGFSNFETKLHAAGRQLSEGDLNAMWLTSLYELYGTDGEIFTYKNTDRLWSYISHFHRPFYCYSYAFGQLLTQSLYAAAPRLGEKFESLYLDLLKSGGTKDAAELLKPFGLDPTEENFWKKGLETGIESLINEAEKISGELDKTEK